jgi:hypothetical protein
MFENNTATSVDTSATDSVDDSSKGRTAVSIEVKFDSVGDPLPLADQTNVN